MIEANVMNLINAAKNGNMDAMSELLCLHMSYIRKVHNYGPDGFNGSVRYENDFYHLSGEIFEAFRNAVRLYNPAKGASFKTFLGQKLRFAALDRIRKSEAEPVIAESSVTESEDSEDSRELSPSENLNYQDYKFDLYGVDEEAEDRQEEEAQKKVCRLLQLFPEGSRQHQYITCTLELCQDGKPHTKEICEAMGCTRQNLYIIQKQIREAYNRAA